VTDDVRAQLLELPGASPDDLTFDAIVTAGTRRRQRRRASLLAASTGIAVVGVLSVVLTVPGGGATVGKRGPVPVGDGKYYCREADVSATLGPGELETSPERRNMFDVRLVVTRDCQLRGPLQLEVSAQPVSPPVPPDPAWTWTAKTTSNYGGSGPQQTTPVPLDPSYFYAVDLGWRPRRQGCEGPNVRLVGPGHLVLPLGRLSFYCGEPIAISNTFAVSVVSSVPWTLVRASGNRVTIHYGPLCRGMVPRVTETSTSVTIAALTNEPLGAHGCLAMTFDGSSTVVTLRRPLGARAIRHAPTGSWPAADFISASSHPAR